MQEWSAPEIKWGQEYYRCTGGPLDWGVREVSGDRAAWIFSTGYWGAMRGS